MKMKKIKKWLIYKLGGIAKQEIVPYIYNIENPKIERLRVYCVDKYNYMPEQIAIEKLVEEFIPLIKEKMLYKKEIKPDGTYYSAELSILNFSRKDDSY